ncbi:MAG: hypothetical protein KKD63_08245 [Proteobacteria bacterium]|nr:hypothetical protein [Desulfobulbaceae bacterium]MBU4152855.1 hypothetical protein [Pseudomonadota bacterium]
MSLSITHHDNTAFWDNRRGVIRTRIGGWIPGRAVYCHGYDMMEDLVGKVSYFQVLMLNATGRLPDRRLADWMEAYFIGNSYPDARIWCNQIGSLAGTMHTSPLTATSAGILASDSKMYGPGTVMAGVNFFVEALAKKMNGLSAEEIVTDQQRHPKAKPVIIGYARPIANGDERIATLDLLAKKLGFERGEHLTLAFEIEQVIYNKTKERMNLLAYVLPFLCDQGYTAREIYRLLSALVYAGVVACYGEAADQPGEAFFPLQCNDIYYQGKPLRKIPEKKCLS